MASWSPKKSPSKREGPGGPYPWSKRRMDSVDESAQGQALTTADIIAAQGQDYVDEKEMEFRQTIQHLAEEQERVQKKVFTNWTNHYLAQHDPPMRVQDLVEDLRDGAKLIALIEHLSGERLHGERGRRLRRPHFLSNINQVLQFLERKRIKLVNINATDVVDGKPAITLGLIWTIILHFQIEEKTRLLSEQMSYLQTCASSTSSLDSVGAHSPMPSRDSPHRLISTAPAAAIKPIVSDKWKGGARKALLHWVKSSISPRFGVEVKDFGSSWRDGMAFLAIIHRIRPNLVDIDQLRNVPNRVRLETAFNIAESQLGIVRLLDPEDVDVPHPDEKSIMTYVAQFLHMYPETYATTELDETDILYSQPSDLETISLWLDKAESVLENRKRISDYKSQYSQFCALNAEMRNLREIYERLRTKVNSGSYDVDLKSVWPSILQRWTKVEKELQDWQNSLDSNLPGSLGQFTKWLMEAERRLALPMLSNAPSNEMSRIAKKALNDHLDFFKPLDSYLKLLKNWQQLPESSQVLSDHVNDLQNRLENVAVLSHQRQVKLQLENTRYALLDLLSDVEEHLKIWNKKYGYESDVQNLLKEYQSYVEGRKIFAEFDKNYALTKTNIETCQHVGALGAKEMDKMEKFLTETDGLWKRMMVDLHSVGNTAKQVLNHWQEFSKNLSPILSWFDKAENAITKDAETQLDFFQDLSHWQEVKNKVVDSGEYLGATCQDDISRDIKQTVNNVRQRWDRLFPHIKDYLQSGEIMRSRHVFQKNINHLHAWISEAESILKTPVSCKPIELEKYTTKLKELQVEWEDYDNLFKKLSKQMHSVVTHMTAPEVEKVMYSIKKDKESMLRLKTNLMTRLQVLYQIVPSLDALEKTVSDISIWLDEACSIIASYGIPSTPQAIAVLQDKHKAFFSQSTGFKSQLESVKNIYKSILEYAKGMPNLQTSDLQIKIANVDARLQSTLHLANQWSNAMSEASNRWQIYHEKLHIVKEKLQSAEAFLSKKPSDEGQLQTHKAFFSNLNDSVIRDLIASSDAVLATLPVSEQNPVKETVQSLQSKWKNVIEKIPSHLLLQEFRIREKEFFTQLHEMKRQIHLQQQLIDGGESAESVLQKHMEFFTISRISNIKSILNRMKLLSEEYQTCQMSTPEVPESYMKDEKEWIQMEIEIEAFLAQLRQLKSDWTEYCQRFNDLLRWMDDVESSIRAITNDITSADEFESIKAKFLAVCQTVDSRREDVKWLVRKLDNLLAHIPEDEGAAEQKKLDDLLARYKSLLPEIDTTIMITETITKCFVYREEVVEVNRWLKEVKAVTESIEETPYDDPQKLTELVQQQEAIVRQLETHLGNVKYSVQKGKDLQVQKMSPKFVAQEVQDLEKTWKEVYQEATDKLSNLKSAFKKWDDYDKQKDEIFRLLKQADDELKKLKQTMNVPQSSKQYKELEKSTETNLKKFKTVGEELAPQLSEKKRPILEKEVVEIEKKVLMVMSTLKENLEYLERSTEKWTNFNFKLEGFVSQIDNIIDRLKNILSETLPPAERLKKLDELHAEILEQKQVLVNLEAESQELAQDQPDSANVKQIIDQLSNLNDKLKTLEETVVTQRNIICKNLDVLNNYRDILKAEREELRAAELRVEAGPPTPASLNETHTKKKEVEQFCEHCHSKINYLSDVGTQTKKELTDASIQCEFDDIQDQWKIIAETVQQWIEQLQIIITLWEGVSIQLETVLKWLDDAEKRVKVISSTDTVDVQKLEDLKAEIRTLASGIDEQRSHLAKTNKDVDDLSKHLSPKAVMALHSQTSDVQKRIDELHDVIRVQTIRLGSVIAEQDQLLKTIDTFTQWVEDVKLQVSNFDDIFVDQIEAVLKKIQMLKIENNSRHVDFNNINEEIKRLNDTYETSEVQQITSLHSKLADLYQNTEELLSKKQKLLQKFLDFEAWHKDMCENLHLLMQKIEGKKYTSEELHNVIEDLSKLEKEFDKKTVEVADLDEFCRNLNQTIRDRSTTLPITVAERLTFIESLIKTVKESLMQEEEGLKKLDAKWKEFHDKHKALCQWLSEVDRKIQTLHEKSSSLSDFEVQMKTVENLQKDMENQLPSCTNLHDLGRSLIEVDSSSFTTIQSHLTALDKQWEQFSSDLMQKGKNVSRIVQLWKECDVLHEQLLDALNNASHSIKIPSFVPSDSVQVSKLLETAKGGNDILKCHHFELDNYNQKCKELTDMLSNIPAFDLSSIEKKCSGISSRWQQTRNDVEARVQNLESQMVLWQQLDLEKEEIISWVTEMCHSMNECLKNFENKEKAQLVLDRYKNELDNHLESKRDIFTKIDSLQKLNKDKEISTLTSLRSVIENHFDELASLASKLGKCIQEISTQESELKQEQLQLSEWLRSMRESVTKCEDVSAGDDIILQNFEICKQLESEINAHKEIFGKLNQKIGDTKQKHSNLDTSFLEKESSNLQARYEKLKTTTSKVKNFLSSSLERRYQLAMQDFQRWLITNVEKVSSCNPDFAGDKYSLESKMGILQEVENNVPQGEAKKLKLEVTANNVLQVLPAERHSEIQSVLDKANTDWESFLSSISSIKASLQRILNLWVQYEKEHETFTSWLRDMESRVKSETSQQVEFSDIHQQLNVVMGLQKEVGLKKKNLDDLLQIIQEISSESPEARLKTHTSQITTRYQTLERTIQDSIRRLESLLKVKKDYEAAKVALENWLFEMEKQLEPNLDITGDKETLQAKRQCLKDILSKKEQNVPKLSAVTDAGEIIYLSLSMEGRDQIRSEMRNLRDSWDEKWEKVNAAFKNVESALMAWGTFEESCKQVSTWLNEFGSQLGSEVQLKPTLTEKKLQLQSYKAMSNGISAHQAIISKLKDKAKALPESAPKHDVEGFQKRYDSLIAAIKERVQICDAHVIEHENYHMKLERFQDWLRSLKAAVDMNVDHGDTEALKMKLIALSTVISSLEEGEQKLEELQLLLQEVLKHTDSKGHPALLSEIALEKELWQNFMKQCQNARDSIQGSVQDRSNCEEMISNLEQWITAKDHILREQVLKSNLEAKVAQLQSLKDLENEILAKQNDMNGLHGRLEQLRGDSTLISRISKILSRYQTLKNTAKESVRKWDMYVKEHESFESKLSEITNWLQEPEKKLKECSILIGDIPTLQERKAFLETLSDQLSLNLCHIEATIELGERLYSSTSPEGREIIRQKIRNLQKQYETLLEKCNAALRAVDSCLQKLSSFTQGQERFSKWLQEVGLAVQQHTEPKSTLQEKRVQLQSQKVIHQDIISHKPLIDVVVEKANDLMSVTGDNSIPSYIEDVTRMYNAMCAKSEGLLSKLKESITDHQAYIDLCKNFQEFLSSCHIKLQECKDTTGEKKFIVGRLDVLKELISRQLEGDKKLSDLETLCTVVCKNTSEHGCEIINHEMKDLKESWSQYKTASLESKHNLENIIQLWLSFEKNVDALNLWFKDIDTALKQPQLQSTMEEKEAQLAFIKDLNEKIISHQKDLDSLTDEAHSLTHSANVESIKLQVSQMNVRYQNLVSLIKTLLSRWETIIQDHATYERKTNEFLSWLDNGRKVLSELEIEESLEQSMIKLQVLVNDRLQGEQLLTETVQAGERLYQDTATSGREIIRQKLRELRDKFDVFSNDVLEVQRQLDSLNQHWISFKETFKQILNWMDSSEKILSQNDLNLPSLQDIAPRLMKYKALHQETESYKRQLDLLQSKVQSVAPLMKEEDLPLSVMEASARFNNLVTVIKAHLDKMDSLSNLFQKCQDERDTCETWCQKSEEKLSLCCDYSGNQNALKAKEEKLKELKESLPTGATKIQSYGNEVQKLSDLVAPKDFEQLIKSHATLEKKFQDISTSVDETLRELAEKIKQWELYDEKCNAMSSWLEKMEQNIKDFNLKTTVDEKIEQRNKFQTLLSELRAKEADFDVLSDESQELIASSGEIRISMGTSQLVSRFQSMLLTCKELTRKCEQHVDDHVQFSEKYKVCHDWIEDAASRFEKVNSMGFKDSESLRQKLELVEALLQSKDEGLNLLSATVQYGEQLQVGSSQEGWETVQAMLQNLQTAFDKVFEGASSLGRSLRSTQFSWSEFDESFQRLQAWIASCSNNFYDSPKLVSTLEEKKSLLRLYKALLIDIKGHEQAIDDLQYAANSLPELDKNIDEVINSLAEKHKLLKAKSEEYITFYESAEQDHEAFNKGVLELQNWLNTTLQSITSCKETNLDRISLVGSLNTVQTIAASFPLEVSKLSSVEKSLQEVLQTTHPDGHENLSNDLSEVQKLFETTEVAAKSCCEYLEGLLKQWSDYEKRINEVQGWMKDIENSLQSICLKENLPEKRNQLEKLKVLLILRK